jgi:hypothetical protein
VWTGVRGVVVVENFTVGEVFFEVLIFACEEPHFLEQKTVVKL